MFYGSCNIGPGVPIPVSSCSGTLVVSSRLCRYLGSLLLCFLSRGIVAVRARSRKKGWIIEWKRARSSNSPGNFRIYEVIVRPFTTLQLLFARLLIFIKTVAGGWYVWSRQQHSKDVRAWQGNNVLFARFTLTFVPSDQAWLHFLFKIISAGYLTKLYI